MTEEEKKNKILELSKQTIAHLVAKEYEEAIKVCDRILEIDPNYSFAFASKGLANAYLGEYEEAARYFVKNGEEAFDIYVLLKKWLEDENANIKELVSYMLDEATGDFFNKTLTDGEQETCKKEACEKPVCTEKPCKKEKYELYKKLYLQTLEIVSLLHVNHDEEKSFAHYTRKESAERLLFDGSPLRLSSTISSNDPKEGHSLLDYLKMDTFLSNSSETERAFESPYQAFIACFTFNHNSLNQFRLYGKENKQEATGVSIVVNSSYFSDTASLPVRAGGSLDKEEIKLPLYRCIYLDPDMKKVIALGHKDEYAFYVENIDTRMSVINDYKGDVKKLKTKVEKGLKILSEMIAKKEYQNLNREVVGELLLPLRYLVKHAAYKEEQECRMIDIEKLSKENDKVKYGEGTDYKYHQLYIEYLKMGQHVKKIYFAPHAPHFELFQNTAKRLGHNFHIVRSKHPFIE